MFAVGNIFHRFDTYNATTTTGSSWGSVVGKLKYLSVGKAIVVGTDDAHDVLIRRGNFF